MTLLGEDGKPVEPEAPKAEETPDEKPQEPMLPRIEIEMRPDGTLSIKGPQDAPLVMRMLSEAHDMVITNFTMSLVLSRLAQARAGIQRPSMDNVLAFSKVPHK